MEWDISSILAKLGIDFQAEGRTIKIRGAAPIGEASKEDLSFCWYGGEKGNSFVGNSNAGVILCKKELIGHMHPKANQQLIFTDNPRLAFVRILNEMQAKEKLEGISPRAVIAKSARIGHGCYIGDYTVIGDNCVIGEGTAIYDRVSLVQNCVIGRNCLIQSGASLGSDGFAFERFGSGDLEKFPHKGYVRVGNNVEIYTNCSIARGSLSDTIIGDGTKLDSLVHIAHNVKIGSNCELTAGTVIGGSTSVGDVTWTGLNSTLKNGIRVGRNVIVASGASVINDVPDGDIVGGVPARSIKHKVKTEEVFLMAGQKKTASA